jgi:hypothetical protein
MFSWATAAWILDEKKLVVAQLVERFYGSLWNKAVRCRIHNSLSLNPTLFSWPQVTTSQLNPLMYAAILFRHLLQVLEVIAFLQDLFPTSLKSVVWAHSIWLLVKYRFNENRFKLVIFGFSARKRSGQPTFKMYIQPHFHYESRSVVNHVLSAFGWDRPASCWHLLERIGTTKLGYNGGDRSSTGANNLNSR